jgi:drug/metabolite transporter (DMT)-like permease
LTEPDGVGADSKPAPEIPTDVRAWLAFAACSTIWGSTFLAISIGNDALAPVWAATLRLILAALLLAGLMRLRGDPVPRGPALRAALGYGVCTFGINFPLLYWGEKMVPSGLSAVLYATIPMSSAFLTRAFGMERLTRAKMMGAVTAFVGVAVLFSSSFHFQGQVAAATGHGESLGVTGLIAIFVATVVSALGSVFLKRGPRQSPVGSNAVGCAVGAVMSGAISLALHEPQVLPTTAAALLPVLYLTIAGSLGAFVIMSWLVHHWTVTRASYVSVVVPMLALGLGALVHHERLTLVHLAGAALVIAGLVIGMRGAGRR